MTKRDLLNSKPFISAPDDATIVIDVDGKEDYEPEMISYFPQDR